MSLLRSLSDGLRSLFRKEQVRQELDEELHGFIEMAAEEKMKEGMSRKDALRAVRLERGNLEVTKEVVRSAGWESFVEALWQDLRFAARMLRKSPGFTVVAVLTLAIGIGANTAIFSLIDTVLLRSLPVRDPQKLVVFQWTAHNSPNTKGYYSYMSCRSSNTGATGEHGCSFSYPMFNQFRALQDAFSSVTALGADVGLNLRGNGPARFVHGELVSGEFFDALGVGAALGRTFGPADDVPGAPPVAVLSYGFWQSAFGGDSAAVGRTVWLNNVPVIIVGVAAKEFPSLDPATARPMWLPLSLQPQLGENLNGTMGGDKPSLRAGDDNWWVYLIARLKPEIPLHKAQAAADAFFRNDVLDTTKKIFKSEDAPRLVLTPAPQVITGLHDRFSTPLTILMTAVALVLLVACANLAGLMLARSATRQRELAVRLALGAGRARIARQLLTESLLLSLAGGASGILLAYWSVQSLVAFMSRGGLWPSHLTVQLDLRVLVFTVAASVFTGILFGLAPVFRGMRLDLTPALKESPTARATGASTRQWLNLGSGLVISQVALAILALSGAGLLVRTLENLKSINPGFDTRNVLLFSIDPTLNGYTDAQIYGLYSQLQQRLEGLPGVLLASYSFDPLLSGDIWSSSFKIEGDAQNTQHMTDALQVGPKFFETLHIPVLAGRTLSPNDFNSARGSTWCPTVVNEAFARQFFKEQTPLGRSISGLGDKYPSCEIVGIVGDAKYQTLRSEISPTVYVPQKEGSATFEVRTTANPETIIPAVRSIVSQLDNNLPLFDVKTQSAQIEGSLFQERLIARLSSFFGGLSLLLACIGLYGLLSYEVARRTREIGVRMALGARPSDVLRFFVRQGVALSAVGAVLGILGALGLTRYLASLLYGVRPFDLLTFLSVALLLGLVALAACYIPARRASHVDPIIALRYE
jgi:predicted permease